MEIHALFSRNLATATNYLNELNQKYLATHKAKEDFFWDTYMGISDDHNGSTQANSVDRIS